MSPFVFFIGLITILWSYSLIIVESQIQEAVLKFTYGDNDELGPSHWKRNKFTGHVHGMKSFGRSFGAFEPQIPAPEKKLYDKNRCLTNWLSPINIQNDRVNAPDLGKATADIAAEAASRGGGDLPETLIISINPHEIENEAWEFGHPPDIYHGIEIRPVNFGMIQLMDNFDPPKKTDRYDTFDFQFLTLFYCDTKKAEKHRTMHQIDGKRFPLELQFVFSRSMKESVIQNGEKLTSNVEDLESSEGESQFDANVTSVESANMFVILSVLGNIQAEENKYFKPVSDAAKLFRGKKFGDYTIDDSNVVRIKSPWSPTWLLPDNSDYLYYDDGSFPVPPCFKVARYYILRERIGISQEQLDILTNIETAREKESHNKLACTFSLLQHEILSGEVTANLIDFELKGYDRKPRSKEEAEARNERQARTREFRQRLAGQVVSLKSLDRQNNGTNVNGVRNIHILILEILFYLSFVKMVLFEF